MRWVPSVRGRDETRKGACRFVSFRARANRLRAAESEGKDMSYGTQYSTM